MIKKVNLLTTLLFSSIIFLFNFTSALAAANDYTVAGGNQSTGPVVGDPSVALPPITITDVGGDDFMNDPEILVLNINTTTFDNFIFDASITNATISGTCGYNSGGTITYSNNNHTATFSINGGTSCSNSETIVINGLKVSTIYNDVGQGPAAFISIDNATTSPGSAINTSDTSTVNNVPSANANITVTLGANATVGVDGNTTLSLTIPIIMENGDRVDINMPSQFDVSNVGFVSETFGGGGSFSNCSALGQFIRCFSNGQINTGNGDLIMSGIKSLYATTGTIATGGSYNAAVGRYTSISLPVIPDTIPNTLTSANVQPNSLSPGVLTNITASFTTSNSIAATDKIKITFGAGFDVSGANGATCSTLDGTFATNVSGQTVTITRSGGSSEPPGTQTCTINAIKNPSAAGTTGTYTIRTTTANDEIKDENASVSADTIISSAKSGVNNSPSYVWYPNGNAGSI